MDMKFNLNSCYRFLASPCLRSTFRPENMIFASMTDSGHNRMIRIGTSSFSESDWVGPFYETGSKPSEFLAQYAKKYATVEIDATYYAIPSQSTVEGWARKTPEHFVFAAKFPRSIVHCGNGPQPRGDLVLTPEATYAQRDIFLERMSLLGDKLGPLLIQFPYFNKTAFASRREFYTRLNTFLADLPTDFRYALETRNKSWLTEELVDMLRSFDIALTLVDQGWMPHGDEVEKMFDPVTTDFSYIRLIGDRKKIEAITTKWDKEVIDRSDSLERWAQLLQRLIDKQVPSFVYVNNHYAGHAPTTISKLNELLDR